MANSSIISVMKDKIITEIINDPAFFHGINSPDIPDVENADDLVNSHIFRYHQNPDTLNKAITFLTLQVHIAKENEFESQNLWIHPKVEIWIISHESCMKVDNIPGVRADLPGNRKQRELPESFRKAQSGGKLGRRYGTELSVPEDGLCDQRSEFFRM